MWGVHLWTLPLLLGVGCSLVDVPSILGVGCSLVDAPSTTGCGVFTCRLGVLLELQSEFWAYKVKSCLRKQWLKETGCGGGSVGKVLECESLGSDLLHPCEKLIPGSNPGQGKQKQADTI